MRELPRHLILKDFYLWFDIKEKEEYYSTPLYLYGVTRTEHKEDETRLYLNLEKDIAEIKPTNKKEIRKHPSTIYVHYAESIGMILLRLLNADFSTFETAYNTFLYAYGFELIREDEHYLESREPLTDTEFLKLLEDIYNDYLEKLLEIQSEFRKCVDFVYNLNGNEELKESSIYSKFVAYTIKNDIYTYSQDIEIILDNYINIHNHNYNEPIENLIKRIEDKDPNLELHNVYTSTKLRSICFIVLDLLVKQENLPIKTCQNCGRYFIPTFRQNEIYCDLENVDGSPSCRDKGANETYKKSLENTPALLLYRRTYQQKVMNVYRNKENKQLKKGFDKWKKEAQAKIKLFKQGKLEEDVLYNWMIENK